jgi:HD-GYP domain-containing protein (c-di-GMP phosphodiesterase class II)
MKWDLDMLQSTENGVEDLTLVMANIGISLGTAEDLTSLLDTILTEAMGLTNADGGSLYLIDDDNLQFEIVKNHSLGIDFGGPNKSPVPSYFNPIPLNVGKVQNVCVWVARTRKTANIPDVQTNSDFDFSGTRRADKANNYRSVSFLTVAMTDHEGIPVGVLQLINALDDEGSPISFDKNRQLLVEALAGMAAVAINNSRLRQELSGLLDAFMSLIAGAIDEKSEYTGGHCRRVPDLVMRLAEKVSKTEEGPFSDIVYGPEDMYELSVAAWLHDIGKIVIPEYVVDKATKLETISDRIHEVEVRFEVLKRDVEIEYLHKCLNSNDVAVREVAKKKYEDRVQELDDDLLFIQKTNVGGEFLSDDKIARVVEIAKSNLTINGVEKALLSADFVKNLSIRKGTLTNEEREIINNHIVLTIDMLEKLPFPRHLRRVPEFAGGHHEKMDGTGYPKGLKKNDMSVQARMMAIADIFEALTASDRPYKKAKKLSDAMRIMGYFKKDNHIDPDLFDIFVKEEVYLDYANEFMSSDLIDSVDKESLLAITSKLDLESRT